MMTLATGLRACWMGMLRDAKFRQTLFLKWSERERPLGHPVYIHRDQAKGELVRGIVDYFCKPLDAIHYPAKAYAVAIIYASLLESHFGLDFWPILKDPQLFQGSAPFFRAYSHSGEVRRTYDVALNELVERRLFPRFNLDLDQVRATVDAFEREFSVHLKTLPEVVEFFAPYLTLAQ